MRGPTLSRRSCVTRHARARPSLAGAGDDVVGAGALGEVAGLAHQVVGQRDVRLDDDAGGGERRVRHVDHAEHVVEDGLLVARCERAAVDDEVDLGRALLERLRGLERLHAQQLATVWIADDGSQR